jgi:AcrR family transcriptional regulator
VARAPRKPDRKDDIVRAAYQLFAQRGYHATNVADIADALEIGHGTFYRSFESKRDVFDHVVALAVTKIVDALSAEDPYAASSLVEYRAQKRRVFQLLFQLMEQDPQLAQIFLYEAPGIDSSINEKVSYAIDQFAVYTAQYIVNGQKKKFLRADVDAMAIARAINGMVFEGARAVHRATPPDRRRIGEEWLAAIGVMILEGIASR